MSKPKILVTGCGRSGTSFMAKVLNEAGLRIGHERILEDGSVDWRAAAKLKNENVAALILHQTRNPVHFLRSMPTITNGSWELIYKNTRAKHSNSILVKSVIYWIDWNEMIFQYSDHTYRIEDFEDNINMIAEKISNALNKDKTVLAKNIKSSYLKSNHHTNTRKKHKKYKDWSIDDIYSESRTLYDELFSIAKKYGYNINT